MESNWTSWLGDVHQILPHWAALATITLAAIVCGGVIGAERERAQKPVDTRTLILICLGSAIFTQASMLMAGDSADRTRIAAQIVTGIGFLGAGAIMHEGGLLVGVTTGAAIWATAAVGVILGAGYVAVGMGFSAVIFLTLGASKFIDGLVMGRCQNRILEVTFDPADGRTEYLLRGVLDEYGPECDITFETQDTPSGGDRIARIRYCENHRHHRLFLPELAKVPGIKLIRPTESPYS